MDARGICWGTITGLTTADSHTSDGTGSGVFKSSLTGLQFGALYHVRAYATNNAGTSYGNEVSFTTRNIVTYTGNGSADGTVPADSATYTLGQTVTVLGNPGGLTRTGYALTGWDTQADGNGTPYT